MGTLECSKLKPYIDKHGRQIIFSPEFGKKAYTLNVGLSEPHKNFI